MSYQSNQVCSCLESNPFHSISSDLIITESAEIKGLTSAIVALGKESVNLRSAEALQAFYKAIRFPGIFASLESACNISFVTFRYRLRVKFDF